MTIANNSPKGMDYTDQISVISEDRNLNIPQLASNCSQTHRSFSHPWIGVHDFIMMPSRLVSLRRRGREQE